MSEPREPDVEPRWWCNFCGYKTDDREAYLAHSCREVLERQGKSVPSSGTEPHCG